MHIVPTFDDSPGSTDPLMLPPNQCYFRGESCCKLYSKLFVFVDFGTSANNFLKACGTKGEPSVEEIALILLKDPQNFFQLAGGQERWGHPAHLFYVTLIVLLTAILWNFARLP